MANSCKSQISSVFSMGGYTLRSEASKYLQALLVNVEEQERSLCLQRILTFLESQSLMSSLLDKSVIELAFHSLGNNTSDDDVTLNVINAFSMPSYSYHSETKKFVLKENLKNRVPSLHGQPDSKADIYLEKYNMVRQKTVCHKLFAPPAISTDLRKETSYSLKSVEHMLGASSKQADLIVLGMLTQLKEKQFFLEDPTGCVKLDLSQTLYKEGLFTENNIVLAEGYYEDDVFHLTSIGFPPPEPASVSLSYFPYIDFASPSSTLSFRLSEKLKAAEQNNPNAMFVILSDVWLDNLTIMCKLRILLSGYSDIPPTCFVFIGNFLTLANAETHTKCFTECFDQLGNMISEFPRLVNESTFVFVPGPNDPGLPYIFPRPPIPEALLDLFRKKVPNAIFTTNPCRIQYCTQEIVIFREDVISKMCRNSIHMPWHGGKHIDVPEMYVKTIVANSHLLPLPLNVSPIYWEYDHALWLYPLPDVVICADKHDPYTIESSGAVFCNPGSLWRTNFAFKVYLPSSKQMEDSEISNDLL